MPPTTPSQVLPGLIAGASLCLPKRLPAKYAAMSATHTINARASSVHGLMSRSTTSANHVGQITIQPATAQVEGDGRSLLRNQSGAATTQNTTATMKQLNAAAAKLPGTTPR